MLEHAYQQILDYIEENSLGKGQLLNGEGEHCIVGYLLHKKGEPDENLLYRGVPNTRQMSILIEAYPMLSCDRVAQLIGRNDTVPAIEDRRRALSDLGG